MQIKKMVKTPSKEIQSLKNLEIVVPLKYLRNCWRTLDMPLIIGIDVPVKITLDVPVK